ncbi:hypothetical protein SAMN04515671_2267 [Nakamurella panacisegetis]|uniref:Fido domain-containing protein n=1 Tax=Nakamurella panacisegetis TaxID=1090615 RepID=A0A1H0NA62_9ACTN|nr:oxidoreductase [Nakamurella panacisegetis]SDO89305.1 hypothetical protein SAMN04515671_2267 [Nakamurella panacisegetis]
MTSTPWPDLLALPGVPEAVSRARTAIEQVHRHPANRRGWPRTSAAASVRAARASAMLDGGSGEIDPAAASVSDPVLAGALRVAAAIGGLVPVWERAPLQALARLHTLAAADLSHPDLLGRPAPDRPDLAARLSALAQTVLAAPWPAPVMVAVVHGEILDLRPFGTADGVVARAAARLTLISSGLDPHGLTTPEVGHLRVGSVYPESAAAFADGSGVAAWIVHVSAALEAGAREGTSIAEAAN